ncbi:zinc finger MYND domain-containing protein 15 [Ananas comosus]|uniref:Zinc finger MYND domain-containing protein 15 n=1 Tax=Ananas comosus TaxID=4615 RepID=A0A6P5FJC9_ANACO|nr:zinc finger MYND domain-containing protein 15 [Ananas comosus]
MDAHLKPLFALYHEQFGLGPGLGPGPGTCLLSPSSNSAAPPPPPPLLRSLFRAAAALRRTDPWRRLRPPHLLGVRVGRDSDWPGKRQPFPCAHFVGGDGGDLGLHLFRSETDALRIAGARDTKLLPNSELFRVIYQTHSLLSPSNKKMIASLSLEPSGDDDRYPMIDVVRCTASGALRFRNPTADEIRFLYAFMSAISLLHPLLRSAGNDAARRTRPLLFDPFIETLDVQWPPEISKAGDFVAVTVSHPPGQAYEEKKPPPAPSSPLKYLEPPPKEELPQIGEAIANWTIRRQCALCEKQFHEKQSVPCGRCRAVVYCSPVCEKKHWKETHKGICGLYTAMMEREEELAMKIFTFPCFVEHPCKWLESVGVHQKGMWRRSCSCYSHYPFGLLPGGKSGGVSDLWGGIPEREFPPDSPFPNYLNGNSNPIFLSGWSEYYNLRSLPMSSPVAAVLSHPFTVYHILTSLVISSKNRLLKGKEVIVHYLGPAAELDWMAAFAEINHLLNGLGSIQIVMIGPEVPSNLSGTVSGISGRLRVHLVKGMYQEQASYLSSPHVVVALNCGLESYGSWGAAIELIKSMNAPAFFTERSELLCANAKQVLRGAGLHVTHPVTPNPFRSPLRDQAPSTNLPSFSNGFVFGVNT